MGEMHLFGWSRLRQGRHGLLAAAMGCCLFAAAPTKAQTLQTAEPALAASASSDDLAIDPAFRAGRECGGGTSDTGSAMTALRCPYAAHSVGLNLSRKLDVLDGQTQVRMGFARGNDAALSLERQLRRIAPAQMIESTLMTLGSDSRLLDGRLRLSNDFGWSRSWESQLTGNRSSARRGYRASGFAQRHSFEFSAIDRPGLRWKLDGSLSRANDDYYTGAISGVGSNLPGIGEMDRIATRLDLGKIGLRGSFTDIRTSISANELRKVSLGYGGVTLGYTDRRGETFSDGRFFVGASQSRGSTLTADFDLFELTPMLAMRGKGLSLALPRQLSISIDERTVTRPGSRLRPLTQRRGVDLTGMWSTPLGQTLVNVSRERLVDGAGGPIERTSQWMVSHSMKRGGWNLTFDVLSLSTRAADRDDDAVVYYSASLSRTFDSGTRLRIELGSDTQSMGSEVSEFTLRDRSHRAKLELDLSAPLRRKLNNDSVRLTLGAQVRLNASRYQLRFMDELLMDSREGYARQGVLASFGYRF